MRTKIDERIKEEYEIKIKGKFKIFLGNELYAKGKNKWTRFFPSSLVEFVATPFIGGMYAGAGSYTIYARGLSNGHTARAGNDTTTPTSPDMTDLISKIDIAPDTKNVVIFKSSGYTEYKSRHKYSWNPGTIPAQTIGEFGIYLWLSDDSWESPQENTLLYSDTYTQNVTRNPALRLGARISSGDGDFDPIYYDSSEALILEWWVTIKF